MTIENRTYCVTRDRPHDPDAPSTKHAIVTMVKDSLTLDEAEALANELAVERPAWARRFDWYSPRDMTTMEYTA